jgi:2-hydroxychromene-2-carboxylate isomerase
LQRWLLTQQQAYSREEALAVARQLGLDPQRLEELADSEAIRQRLVRHIELVEQRQVTWAPRLYLNGRRVTQWTPSAELLERILATVP